LNYSIKIHKEASNKLEELVYFFTNTEPSVEIALGYIMNKSSRIALDESLKRLTDLKFQYRSRARIRVSDPASHDWCSLHLRDNSTEFTALTQGTLTDRITANMTTAEALCTLADYVKQRQDFYRQEEQK